MGVMTKRSPGEMGSKSFATGLPTRWQKGAFGAVWGGSSPVKENDPRGRPF